MLVCSCKREFIRLTYMIGGWVVPSGFLHADEPKNPISAQSKDPKASKHRDQSILDQGCRPGHWLDITSVCSWKPEMVVRCPLVVAAATVVLAQKRECLHTLANISFSFPLFHLGPWLMRCCHPYLGPVFLP